MSRDANPGPVHMSGVGNVCWPFWGGPRSRAFKTPCSVPSMFSLAVGTVCFSRSAPSASRQAAAGELGEQSVSSAAFSLRAHLEAHGTLPSPSRSRQTPPPPAVVVTWSPAPRFCSQVAPVQLGCRPVTWVLLSWNIGFSANSASNADSSSWVGL